ncbi:DUF2158 domain-containing protein [Acinetobacter baumannii]
MSEIKAGDVVKLKSGGHSMTVEKVRENTRKAACVWFVEGEIKTYDFELAALKVIE